MCYYTIAGGPAASPLSDHGDLCSPIWAGVLEGDLAYTASRHDLLVPNSLPK